MEKNCKAHILPAEEKPVVGSIISRNIDKQLAIINPLTINDKNTKRDGHKVNHIYITDNSPLKDGDYCIEDYGGVVFGPYEEGDVVLNPQKIIATTDLFIGRKPSGEMYPEWDMVIPYIQENDIKTIVNLHNDVASWKGDVSVKYELGTSHKGYEVGELNVSLDVNNLPTRPKLSNEHITLSFENTKSDFDKMMERRSNIIEDTYEITQIRNRIKELQAKENPPIDAISELYLVINLLKRKHKPSEV